MKSILTFIDFFKFLVSQALNIKKRQSNAKFLLILVLPVYFKNITEIKSYHE